MQCNPEAVITILEIITYSILLISYAVEVHTLSLGLDLVCLHACCADNCLSCNILVLYGNEMSVYMVDIVAENSQIIRHSA
jgi:hypothetical protein